jgi:ribosome-associated protein
MLIVNERLQVPDEEFIWTYARSGGPGGQNVNKVASKAVLRWDVAHSPTLPDEVKIRLALQQKRFFTQDGAMIVTSQRYRDQERNREDCLEKLRALLLQALVVPRQRRPTRPTRGSRQRRLQNKKHRSAVKRERQRPRED